MAKANKNQNASQTSQPKEQSPKAATAPKRQYIYIGPIGGKIVIHDPSGKLIIQPWTFDDKTVEAFVKKHPNRQQWWKGWTDEK